MTQTAPWRPSPAPSSSSCRPGLGHRRHVAGEVAPGGLRRAAHVGGGQVAQARERDEPLDDVGLGGEELLAAQPEAVDEAVHEEVGARGVQRAGGRAVQLEEAEDALARLGRQLGRLGRGHQRADHVELAPARDLHAARDVDRAQLDRRAGEGAHDGAGVAGIDEQPQPGEHVLDLGALEEGGRAGQAVGHRALLEGDGDRLALVAHRAHEHRRSRRAPPPSARAARSRPRCPGPGRARWRSARSARRRRAARRPPSRCGPRSAPRRPAPPCRMAAGARSERSRRTVCAPGSAVGQVAQVPGRRAAPAAHRAVVVARGGQPAVLAAERERRGAGPRARGPGRRRRARGASARETRARTWGLSRRRATARSSEVAEVQRALLAQHPVVGLVEAGELALALGALVALRAGRRPSARPRRR